MGIINYIKNKFNNKTNHPIIHDSEKIETIIVSPADNSSKTEHRIKNKIIIPPLPVNVIRILDDIGRTDKKWADRLNARLKNIFENPAEECYSDSDTIEDHSLNTINNIVSRLAEVSSDLNYQNNLYLHEVADKCDAYANESIKVFINDFEKENLRFLSRQFDLIRNEVDSNYKAYTGTMDSFKHLAKKVINSDKLDSLLEKSFAKYLNEDIISSFTNNTLTNLSNTMDKGWVKIFNQALNGIQNRAILLNQTSEMKNLNTPEHKYDIASILGGTGIVTVGISTAVLAAGWHTLAWTLGGLTVWALPIVMVLTGAIAVFRKEKEKMKLIDSINEHEKFLTDTIRDNIRYRIRQELQDIVENKSAEIKSILFKKNFGNFEYEYLKKLIYSLEAYIEEIYSFDPDGNNKFDSPASNWLSKARHYLNENNDISAAIYASFSFEDLLREINRKKNIGFNFRQEGHNYMFIERLMESQLIDTKTYGMLQSLRDRRNSFIHRIHIHAARDSKRRIQDVERFINDINSIQAVMG